MSERARYKAEVDYPGCEHCSSDRMWTIIQPDGIAFGQSWGDKEFVDELVSYLNEAFDAGWNAAQVESALELQRIVAEAVVKEAQWCIHRRSEPYSVLDARLAAARAERDRVNAAIQENGGRVDF